MSNTRIYMIEVPIQLVKACTEKAVLVVLENYAEKWIPRSNISYKEDKNIEDFVGDLDKVSIFVAEWYAKQEELI